MPVDYLMAPSATLHAAQRAIAAAISAAVGGALAFFGIIHEARPVLGGERPTSFLIGYAMVAALFVLKWALDKRDPSLVDGQPRDDAPAQAAVGVETAAVATAGTTSDPLVDGTERAPAAAAEPEEGRARV